MIIMIIRRLIDDMNESRIINIILSKLEFCSNHYNIIRKRDKIYIRCHCMIEENKFIYDDLIFKNYNIATELYNKFDKKVYNINAIKLVNIIINLKEKKYKINITSIHILNDKNDIFSNMKNKINNNSYYFINNLIDSNLKINDNRNIIYNETQNCALKEYLLCNRDTYLYDKYTCSNYHIILTNDKERIQINSLLTSYSKNIEYLSNDIGINPLISNEIRIKEIESSFI